MAAAVEERVEPDRVEGAPHPRDALRLIGQEAAEAEFLDAFNSGRMHHGWMLTGPRGVGKATLAWRIARFLLATPDAGEAEAGLFGDAPAQLDTLDIAPDHPVARRVHAGSESRLYHITRSLNDKGVLRREIVAEDVRHLNHFMHLSATDGGRRVVLIDSADEMNTQAANALLKMLEEPPAKTVIVMVSHQPSALLPTIRSRCRALRLKPLDAGQMAEALAQAGVDVAAETEALAELSAGSVGAAVRLINLDGMALYAALVNLLATLPSLDRAKALALGDLAAARGQDERFALLLTLIDLVLMRLARTGATGRPPAVEAAAGEREMLLRLAPDAASGRAWAEAGQEIGARARHGRAVNLDPAALVLDTVFKIQETAKR